MCGIAGAMGRAEALAERVQRMTAALAHRGPDGQSLWADSEGSIVLGHRRLSIIDLSDGGLQPKISPRTGAVIAFNGEIYNYLELRRELQEAGLSFTTDSDSEVLLAACDHWGMREALRRSEGMFAIAHYHPKEGVLTLARDRAGKKPLYYLRRKDTIYFASEIKALTAIFASELDLDRRAIDLYLTLGYIPRPLTAYREIREVAPASVFAIDRSGHAREQSFWEYPVGAVVPETFDDAVAHAEEKLRHAVKLRLRADVPVGVFLSGGIDSGLITAIAAEECANPLRTFTVAFRDGAFNEAPLAREVSARYGTLHHEVELDLDADRLLREVVAAYDEPFGDPSALPTMAVAAAASRELKVVLSGEGSDEQFGGYRRHLAARVFAGADRATFGAFGRAAPALAKLLPHSSQRRTSLAFLKRFLSAASPDPFARFIGWSTDGFSIEEKSRLMRGGGEDAAAYLAQSLGDLSALDPLRHAIAVDFLSMLPDALLVKGDIATMAHGLEARSPFLDSQLTAWAARLPNSVKFRGTSNKPILRALAKKFLPQSVVSAPKRGFEIPVAEWMETRWLGMLRDLSHSGILAEMFDRAALASFLRAPQNMSRERWSNLLWLLLMLALWDEHRRAASVTMPD